MYLRSIDRQLQNEMNLMKIIPDGVEDTYGHAGRIPKKGKNDGKGRGNGAYKTLPRKIGISREGLIALLVKKWNMGTIMWIITMALGVILIINGDVLKTK